MTAQEGMRVFTDMAALPVFDNPVVTVGSFDGVHLGHLHLLEIMRERAHESGGETVVVTFASHPRKVLKSEDELGLLTSLNEKAFLLDREGVDNLVVMPFDEATSRLSPEDFLRDFLIGRLGAKELVVGYNHHFGHGKEGSAAMLRGLEAKYGFRICEALPIAGRHGEKISSTAIREAVAKGEMRQAERLLGHPYIIIAAVGEHGELYGDEPLKLMPPEGRYYVVVNGRNAVFSVAADGTAAVETSFDTPAGTELLISF